MSEGNNLSLQVATLQQIQKTAVEAAGVEKKVAVRDVPAERGRRYLLVDNEGESEFVSAPPPDRGHVLSSLEEFPGYLAYAREKLNAKPVVWYSDKHVIAVLDDSPESYRSDWVRLHFEETPEFTWLRNATDGGSETMSQKQLVALLRTTLSACATPSSTELLKVARNLSATTSTTAGGRIENHRESLGRDIENEVRSDAGEIPEFVEFRVRVLTDRLMRAESVIRCMIEIDPRTLAIQIFPRPEDIRTAIEETVQQVGEYLDRECASADCRVFFGSPS